MTTDCPWILQVGHMFYSGSGVQREGYKNEIIFEENYCILRIGKKQSFQKVPKFDFESQFPECQEPSDSFRLFFYLGENLLITSSNLQIMPNFSLTALTFKVNLYVKTHCYSRIFQHKIISTI